jgi:hypothetical protein
VNWGPPWSDQRFEIDPHGLLDAAFDMRITITDIVPRMLNSAVSSALAKRLHEQDVRLFRPCNPDYSCFIAMALHAKGMVFLDAPLLVSGATPMSVGASATQRGETARKFLEELLTHEPNLVMLPPPRTQANWIAQTFEQCQQEIAAITDREVNRVHLYGLVGLEIRRSALSGVDVTDWERDLASSLDDELRGIRNDVERFIAAGKSIETDAFLRRCDETAVLGYGACFVSPQQSAPMHGQSIEGVGANIDRWVGGHGASIDAMMRAITERAHGRACVTYGLGLNGRAIVRSLGHPLQRWVSMDDGSDLNPADAPRLAAGTRLDPHTHFVLITPYESAAIRGKLAVMGFVPQRDMMALSDWALNPGVSQLERDNAGQFTSAAGSPSGCR